MLIEEGVLVPFVLLFLNPVILRKPLLKPECLFLSISVKIVGISILVPALEDLFDRLVLGLRSLEAQDVGAVEWDSIEPWFGSEDTVIVDKDEAMPFMSVGD